MPFKHNQNIKKNSGKEPPNCEFLLIKEINSVFDAILSITIYLKKGWLGNII